MRHTDTSPKNMSTTLIFPAKELNEYFSDMGWWSDFLFIGFMRVKPFRTSYSSGAVRDLHPTSPTASSTSAEDISFLKECASKVSDMNNNSSLACG